MRQRRTAISSCAPTLTVTWVRSGTIRSDGLQLRRSVRRREAEEAHSGGARGRGARGSVLDDEAVGGRDAQLGRSFKVGFGVRLAAA